MTDKTDPRLMLLDTALGSSADGFYVAADDLLSALDAAGRAAGIVRVDTNDEALVERLAEVVCFNGNPWPCYAANSHRDQARAVLAALREAQ